MLFNRDWRFEASNNGLNWDIIHEHKKDETSIADQVVCYKVEKRCRQYYMHFRILLTGVNTNGDHCLSINAFELYGTLNAIPMEPVQSQNTHRFAIVELKRISNAVTNAVLGMTGMTVTAPEYESNKYFLQLEKKASLDGNENDDSSSSEIAFDLFADSLSDFDSDTESDYSDDEKDNQSEKEVEKIDNKISSEDADVIAAVLSAKVEIQAVTTEVNEEVAETQPPVAELKDDTTSVQASEQKNSEENVVQIDENVVETSATTVINDAVSAANNDGGNVEQANNSSNVENIAVEPDPENKTDSTGDENVAENVIEVAPVVDVNEVIDSKQDSSIADDTNVNDNVIAGNESNKPENEEIPLVSEKEPDSAETVVVSKEEKVDENVTTVVDEKDTAIADTVEPVEEEEEKDTLLLELISIPNVLCSDNNTQKESKPSIEVDSKEAADLLIKKAVLLHENIQKKQQFKQKLFENMSSAEVDLQASYEKVRQFQIQQLYQMEKAHEQLQSASLKEMMEERTAMIEMLTNVEDDHNSMLQSIRADSNLFNNSIKLSDIPSFISISFTFLAN